jgi:hypothetical protein
MTDIVGPTSSTDRVDLVHAVDLALRAPSVHNTQPLRWRIRAGAVELHVDRFRHLAATDPIAETSCWAAEPPCTTCGPRWPQLEPPSRSTGSRKRKTVNLSCTRRP